jgi:ribose-phosphate pyrophosphokinase
MIVFSGRSSEKLGRNIAEKLNADLGKIEIKSFPDGEIYVKALSEVRGKECVVVQSTPGNEDFVELILILDLLRDLGASKIHTVIPYMGYSRQDKRFTEGEALSAKTMLKIIDSFSDSIVSVNMHFLDFGGVHEYQGVKVRNIDAFHEIACYFKTLLKKPILIAPDKGSVEYAKKAAELLGCEFDFLKKTRLSGEEVVIEAKHLDVHGKDAIILDDMISTGGTVIEAAKVLRKHGIGTVNVGCVHGLFSKGIGKVKNEVDTLVCTDSLEKEISKVSLAEIIAREIKKVSKATP